MATGGTDTHTVLADPSPLGVDGRTARDRLAAAGMVLDVCALPHAGAAALRDGHGRGIRLGTAAVTTQGMDEADVARIAVLLADAVRDGADHDRIRAEVRGFAERYQPFHG